MSLTPRVITSRGSGIASTFRYLNKRSEGRINISGIYKDRKYKEETGRSSDRWNLTWKNESVFNDHWISSINFQSASDEYFFRDIGNNQFGQARTSYLPKKFGITWKNPFLKLNLQANRYQILNPFSVEEYRSLPSLNIDTYFAKKWVSFSLLSNITKFEKEKINSSKIPYKDIQRIYLAPEITFKKHFPSSKFSFSFGSTYTNYKFESSKLSRSSPWTEIQYSIFLDKNKNNSFSSLLPTLKYVYVKADDADHEYIIDSRIASFVIS